MELLSISDVTKSLEIQPLSNIQRQIQMKQRENFRNLSLPRSLWLMKKWLPLEELFMELTMSRKNVRGVEVNKKIHQEEIFDQIEGRISQRILIEGHPGYGKTTLIAKFLSDWSNELRSVETNENQSVINDKRKFYISNKFALVFVIPLRIFDGRLESHLYRQCEGVKGSEEEKLRAIDEIQERVLLLLDGLDEIDDKLKEKLLPLFQRKQYPNMTVLVTCRTGMINVGKEITDDIKSLPYKAFQKHSIWEKRIQIKGISEEKRLEFLRKYLNVEEQELEEMLLKSNIHVNDFYECPLFLLLLAVLMHEKNLQSTGTKTELYKTIFKFVINRCLDREKLLLGNKSNFDVFDFIKEDQFGCRKMLLNIGRICLDKIKKHSLIFEESELLKCSDGDQIILKLGFLSKQITFLKCEETNHYEPIHKSFLEFSAAFYLSTLDECVLEEEINELLFKFNIWPEEGQLIYIFLGGFLKTNAFKLFNALSASKSLIFVFNDYLKNFHNVQDILFEIPLNEEVLKSLSNLSPGNWEDVKYKENLHSWFVGLLNHYLHIRLSEKISIRLPEYQEVINSLLENIRFNRIHLDFNEYESKRYVMKFKSKYIQCRSLLIESIKMSENFLNILKEIMNVIQADKIWLEIDEFNLNQKDLPSGLEHLLDNCEKIIGGNLQYFNIDRITFKTNFNLVLEFCKGGRKFWIQKEENSHYCVFSNRLNLVDIVNHLSDSLDSISYEQQMNFICLKEEMLELDVDNLGSVSVQHFQSVDYNSEAIRKILCRCRHIKRLSCQQDSLTECTSLETVERLDIIRLHEINFSFHSVMYCFKILRHLHVDSFNNINDLIDLLSALPGLLKFSVDGSISIDFFQKLLTLKKENPLNAIYLDEIKVGKVENVNEFVTCLEKCFCANIFQKFAIANDYFRTEVQNLLKYFLSTKKCDVSYVWREEDCSNPFMSLNRRTYYRKELPELQPKIIITYCNK